MIEPHLDDDAHAILLEDTLAAIGLLMLDTQHSLSAARLP
jgi:hypothetical protein